MPCVYRNTLKQRFLRKIFLSICGKWVKNFWLFDEVFFNYVVKTAFYVWKTKLWIKIFFLLKLCFSYLFRSSSKRVMAFCWNFSWGVHRKALHMSIGTVWGKLISQKILFCDLQKQIEKFSAFVQKIFRWVVKTGFYVSIREFWKKKILCFEILQFFQ